LRVWPTGSHVIVIAVRTTRDQAARDLIAARLDPAAGGNRAEPAGPVARMTGRRPAEAPGRDAGGLAGRTRNPRDGPAGDGIGQEGLRHGESARRGARGLVASNKTAHRMTAKPHNHQSNHGSTAGHRWP